MGVNMWSRLRVTGPGRMTVGCLADLAVAMGSKEGGDDMAKAEDLHADLDGDHPHLGDVGSLAHLVDVQLGKNRRGVHRQQEQEQERGHGADRKQAGGELLLAKPRPLLTSVARQGARRDADATRDGLLGEARAPEQHLEDADPAGGAEAARRARAAASREAEAWLEATLEGLRRRQAQRPGLLATLRAR